MKNPTPHCAHSKQCDGPDAAKLKDEDNTMRYKKDIYWPFEIWVNSEGEITKLKKLYAE